ncbi:hypothetical protein OG729_00610 [Streptomyces sp. NBC_00210]|uniref:hypothetical protein n=1 Tax=unclassified Streptomyces TaxID=2593676 RepID=UPI0032483AE4
MADRSGFSADPFGSRTGHVNGGGIAGQGSLDGGVRPGALRTSTGRTASGAVFVTGLLPMAAYERAPAITAEAAISNTATNG